MNVVEVFFDYNNSSSFFKNKNFNLKVNLTVIVETEKGLQFGKVVRIIDDLSKFDGVFLYDVVRVSSKKDYFHYLENLKLADEAVMKCKELAKKNELNMTILDGYYNFDRSQLLFRFVADDRVDFRKLARELGATFRTRIELRQIGIRDKAKNIGGVGPCGRLLCCSSFLTNFDSVTINMAKNQNVSLNPSKINGVCGRLLCCLKYENDAYVDLKKNVPKVGTKINIPQGSGKVVSVNLLKQTGVVELENKSKVEVDFSESKE
jgi:cell fate regulator YaaT (PSP1 superfamily)